MGPLRRDLPHGSGGVGVLSDAATVVNRLYDLWNARDLDAAVELGADDIEITLMAYGQTLRGPDGFRRFMERFAVAFPAMKKRITNQVAEGNQVVTEFALRGTHDGPLAMPNGELAPTGQTVDLSSIEVITVRDGKVASIRNYSDAAALLRQLG